MHNPDSAELDMLQEAAIARGNDALGAFNDYTSALAEYDEAVDEHAALAPFERAVERARLELDAQLRRLTQ